MKGTARVALIFMIAFLKIDVFRMQLRNTLLRILEKISKTVSFRFQAVKAMFIYVYNLKIVKSGRLYVCCQCISRD